MDQRVQSARTEAATGCNKYRLDVSSKMDRRLGSSGGITVEGFTIICNKCGRVVEFNKNSADIRVLDMVPYKLIICKCQNNATDAYHSGVKSAENDDEGFTLTCHKCGSKTKFGDWDAEETIKIWAKDNGLMYVLRVTCNKCGNEVEE
jgi:Fe2+ or Zn2+ uptake regulation protein